MKFPCARAKFRSFQIRRNLIFDSKIAFERNSVALNFARNPGIWDRALVCAVLTREKERSRRCSHRYLKRLGGILSVLYSRRDERRELAYQQSSATFAVSYPRTRGSSMPKESPDHAKGNRPKVTNSWVDTIYRLYLHEQETWNTKASNATPWHAW